MWSVLADSTSHGWGWGWGGALCMTLRRFLLVTHISIPKAVFPGHRSSSTPWMQHLSVGFYRGTSKTIASCVVWNTAECAVPFSHALICIPWSLLHSENCADPESHRQLPRRQSQTDRLCAGSQHPELGTVATPSPGASAPHFCHYTPKCFLAVHRGKWRISWHHWGKPWILKALTFLAKPTVTVSRLESFGNAAQKKPSVQFLWRSASMDTGEVQM